MRVIKPISNNIAICTKDNDLSTNELAISKISNDSGKKNFIPKINDQSY